MCGRFAFYSPAEAVHDFFAVDLPAGFTPRFNIAPSTDVLVIRAEQAEERQLEPLRWGLIPFWAKDKDIGNRLINARSETVTEKPAFRRSYARMRCVIPATGFYEWQKHDDGPNQPWFFSSAWDRPLALAGLWDRWQDGDDTIESFTILTTAANETVRPVHHRMPVLLEPESLARWLAPENHGRELTGLLRPAPDDWLDAWPVSRNVNSPANEGADLVVRLQAIE